MLPVLRVGDIAVGTHDLFSTAGIALGIALYFLALQRRGMLDERIALISVAVLIGGGVGGRLLLSWEHLEAYEDLGSAPLTWVIEHSGKSLLGAIAGGWVAAVVTKRALRYPFSTGDCYALAIPVAVAVGRVGCYLSELPLGTPTTMPWGVTVPASAAGAFPWCPGCDGPMHPSMLYEVAFNLAAIGAIVVWGGRVPIDGDLLKAYLLAAFTFRFLVEFVRGNEPQAFGLSGPQLVLIPMTALLVVHFVREARSGLWHVAAPPPSPLVVQEGGDNGLAATTA
ncbi:MAG TPA: prolipoprotein diacylglyceryl transferase family protein [Candidatus Limnocylindrales bacterium]|jgi:prolipoprotein diacylglyceryltransferase